LLWGQKGKKTLKWWGVTNKKRRRGGCIRVYGEEWGEPSECLEEVHGPLGKKQGRVGGSVEFRRDSPGKPKVIMYLLQEQQETGENYFKIPLWEFPN